MLLLAADSESHPSDEQLVPGLTPVVATSQCMYFTGIKYRCRLLSLTVF